MSAPSATWSGLWFDRKRALAISLALNGASSGGILVTPALVLAIAHFGFADAMLGSALLVAAVLLPVDRALDRPAAVPLGTAPAAAAAAAAGRAAARCAAGNSGAWRRRSRWR